jgi:hypothetical protein
MTIKITLKTDNAAFEDEDAEILRILQTWAARGARGGSLFDSTGNRVGSVTVTGRRKERDHA